jgi:hypothetical protein
MQERQRVKECAIKEEREIKTKKAIEKLSELFPSSPRPRPALISKHILHTNLFGAVRRANTPRRNCMLSWPKEYLLPHRTVNNARGTHVPSIQFL